jgi:hypothetical protein
MCPQALALLRGVNSRAVHVWGDQSTRPEEGSRESIERREHGTDGAVCSLPYTIAGQSGDNCTNVNLFRHALGQMVDGAHNNARSPKLREEAVG